MKRFLLAAAAGLLLIQPKHTPADDAAPGAAPQPASARQSLQFRRVYAPAGRLKDWPLGNVPYRPMPAKDFEQLIAAVHQDDQGAPRATGAQLLRADYRARLRSPDVLEGEANLAIEHRTTPTVLLALEPLGLAISQATWPDGPPRGAVLGRSSDGRLGVMVERSGDLKLTWSLRGERNPAGEMTFSLELPVCPAGQLTIDLPAALVPSVDRGLIRQRERPDDASRRWSIDLGGSHHLLLRVASNETGRARKPLALVRQTTAYEFSPRGIDVSVQLRLDVHDAPLDRLELQIDPRLRLVAAHYADRDVPWSAAGGPGGPGTRVILELPEPITGTGRTVRLSALAPLEENQRWRLPVVRAEGTTWLEGTTQLVVPKPLVVEQLVTAGCRQSKAAPLGAPLLGESLEFQCFSPEAAIDVVVGRPHDALRVDTGSAIELSAVEISCRSVAELSLRQGEEFVIGCEIGPQWLIDSVDSSGPDVIEDWQIETQDGRPPRLTLSLKKGVSSNRPVQLTILGHRTAQANQGLGIGELEMLRFEGEQGKRWLALHASDAQELQLNGADELMRLDPQQFTPAESRLFVEPPTGLVFAITPAADRLRIGTAPRKPGYGGEINIDVIVDGTSLTETFIFRCAPQSSRLDRVLVFCSHARQAPLRFSLAGGSSGQISARRLPSENFTALGAAPGGEVWEITLRLPRTGPFEIRGVRTVPLSGKTPLSLASLPEASSSRGTLAIRALGETSVTIDNQRLKPIPAELSQADAYQTARGTFRYEPSRDAANPDAAIFVHASGPNASESGAWVWQARLDSRYALRDSTVHMASWRVQTAGRSQLHFTLPPNAELRSVAIDEVPIAETVVTNLGQQFAVDLPAGKQFANVVLYFATPGELPRLTQSIDPAWPQVDVPVLGRRWRLWMPAGYELSDSDERWESPAIDPPTWSERLFGPLGRPRRTSKFDPFASADWSELIGRGGEGQTARGNLLQFRAALSTALAQAESGQERLSWGELFGRISATLAMAEITALADARGLNQIALVPDLQLPTVDESAGRDRGLALLQQARLFVLASAQGVVLTSEPAVSDYRLQLGPTGERQSGQLLPGPLADSLDPAARGGSVRAVPLAQWAAAPTGPWRRTPTALSPAWESRGWNTYTLSWGAEPVAPVRIVLTTSMQSLSWGVFLLVLAVAAWKFLDRLHVLMSLAALWVAAALLVTPAFVPLAAAGFLGALCGILFAVTERHRSPPHRTDTSRRASLAPATAMLLALTAASAVGLGMIVEAAETPPAVPGTPAANPEPTDAPLRATGAGEVRQSVKQDGGGDTQTERGEVQRVFVPVDEAQKPVGTDVYVPLEFYQALRRQVAAASEQPGDWLLTRAAYRVTLSPQGAEKNVGVAELKATFDLEVFRPNAIVKLPLGHDGLALVSGSAKLDGRAIEVLWPESERVLSVDVEQAGVCRLELALEPVLHSEGGTTGFEMSIPQLPDASLSVISVGDPVAVEVTGARGSVASVMPGAILPAANDHELRAEIGPSDRIGLRWPDEKGQPASLPNLDVEELIWVKLQPGSPVIDARFKFRVIDGKVRRVRVLADPRLRLLPSWNVASAVTALHTLPGDPETIELELSAGAGEQVVVDLTFLVAGTSGIGNFRLPRLEASGARLTARLLAVTLDPALVGEEQVGDEVRQLTPADFAAAWGEVAVKPQLVYAIPRGEAAWSLGTRPREARSSVEQAVTIGLGAGTASVELNGTINTTAGHQFQLRLIGPSGLEVDNVTLLDDGVERMARWAKGDAGTITAFLSGPVSGRQQFALHGRLRIPTAGETDIPSFQWPGAEVKKNQLQVFRQAKTLVQIEPAADMAAIEPLVVDKVRPDLGRLVAAYLLGSTQSSLKVKLAVNDPETEAREVIVVERKQDLWTATVDYQVAVSRGLLDVLRFDIPPQWSEPYQVDPSARIEILPIPGEGRRQLVIHPAEPIADHYHVKIRGRVVPSMGDRLRVPDIIPRGATKLDRFVALPNEWESQPVDWEMTGLTPATAPANWQWRPAGGLYQVLGERFQAALKSIERVSGRPRVRLSDVCAAWHADGAFAGVASFDLDPAGSAQAVLNVPQQIELVHLSVAGLPVIAAPAGPDNWRIALQSTQLPQRVEVVFRGTLDARSGPIKRVQVPAPSIEGVEVDRTLWTVYGPPSAGLPSLLEPTSSLSAVRQELSRLEATESILDLASHVASEQAPEEIRRWYAPWNARFVAARNRIQELARLANRPSAARDQELDALNRQEMSIAERLGVGSGLPEETSLSLDTARIFDGLSARGSEPARSLFEGDATALTLRYASAPGSQFVWRLLVALLAVAVAVFFARSVRPPTIVVSPRIVVLLLSLFAWLCLAPSGLGFVALLLTIIAILTRRWRIAAPERRSTLAT